jgi:MYXO-CTERM domain-containing protein
LTAQNTGGGLTIYENRLPSMALSCNYCTGEQAMKDFIASSSQGWDGTTPRFLIIQAQPWQGVTPTSFLNVARSLSADYVVVRPDHIFELLREANGLPINPVRKYTISASAGANGDISPSGTVMLDQNENQTFTITPQSGYAVSTLSVDGVAEAVAASYTFTNVTANHTISITFANPTTPMDASVGDAAVGDAGTADGGTGGSDDAGGGPGPGSGGCSCQMQHGSRPSAWSLLVLLALGLRRRSRRASRVSAP